MALVLTIHPGDRILLGRNVVLEVVADGSKRRLAITAPRKLQVTHQRKKKSESDR